ncbi:hypothetical protein Tco_1172707 [Tanacetum coccineum]
MIDSNDGRGGGGLEVLGGRSSRESKSSCGEVGGVKKMSSMGSKLMVRGEECLEGCVGAGRDDFGVSKSLFGDILGVMIGESVEKHLEIMEEPFSNRLEVIELGMKAMMDKGIVSLLERGIVLEQALFIVKTGYVVPRVEDLLQGIWAPLAGPKPADMTEAKYNSQDEKAYSTILLSLSDKVLYEVADEETAAGV